jgi:hypothetical protein
MPNPSSFANPQRTASNAYQTSSKAKNLRVSIGELSCNLARGLLLRQQRCTELLRQVWRRPSSAAIMREYRNRSRYPWARGRPCTDLRVRRDHVRSNVARKLLLRERSSTIMLREMWWSETGLAGEFRLTHSYPYEPG